MLHKGLALTVGLTVCLGFHGVASACEKGLEACPANLTGQAGYFPNQLINSGGILRSYNIYVPSGYKPTHPTPLVFNFHGQGGDPEEQNSYTKMDELAELHKFILVTPRGYDGGVGVPSWNAGTCCWPANDAGIDDVGFVSDMIKKISQNYCVNPRRTYATGISNGGNVSDCSGTF